MASAYTTETPYSVLTADFMAKNAGKPTLTDHYLREVDQKWNIITKLAANGRLTGKKY
jgi:hypothetical protein